MLGERTGWTAPREAGDDEQFLRIIDRLATRVFRTGEPDAVHLVRIDNWFGPKWLGFAGKVLGAVGRHTDATRGDLVVPPFTPSRVVWERHFTRERDGYVLRNAGTLHRGQTGSANLTRRLGHVSPRAHYLWFSGNTRANGRGSALVLSLNDDSQDAYYLGLIRKARAWQLDHVGGHPPFDQSKLLKGETKRGADA